MYSNIVNARKMQPPNGGCHYLGEFQTPSAFPLPIYFAARGTRAWIQAPCSIAGTQLPGFLASLLPRLQESP